MAPDILHVELGNFQSDKGLKEKFNSVNGANFFYCSTISNIFWVENPTQEKSCVFNEISTM
jgi:hypothetical protein